MVPVMIGIDPHKGSHTAVAIDPAEVPLGQLQVRACAAQADRLLGWAQAWPQRTWAVEGAGGLGHLLAQPQAPPGPPGDLASRPRRGGGSPFGQPRCCRLRRQGTKNMRLVHGRAALRPSTWASTHASTWASTHASIQASTRPLSASSRIFGPCLTVESWSILAEPGPIY